MCLISHRSESPQGDRRSKGEEAAGRRLFGQLAERLQAALSTSSLQPSVAVASLTALAGLRGRFPPPAPLIAGLLEVLQRAGAPAVFGSLSKQARALLLIACCALQAPEAARELLPFADHLTIFQILELCIEADAQQVGNLVDCCIECY